jgi:hypothetical protein
VEMTALIISQICGASVSVAFLISSIFRLSFQSKFPNHSLTRFVEDVFASNNAPKSCKLPTPDGEFVEKRNVMSRFNRIEHRPVKRIKLLVAAPTRACVENCVLRRPSRW